MQCKDQADAERRRSPRLAMKLNVSFAPVAEEGPAAGNGKTENVSAGGMYFRTFDWKLLGEGKTLDLTVSGLSHYDNGPLFRTLKGQATILRLDAVEPPDGPHAYPGVAVRFNAPLRMETVPPAAPSPVGSP